jgi:hypothetical protein
MPSPTRFVIAPKGERRDSNTLTKDRRPFSPIGRR